LARAGAADVGELPVISDDLLACVGDVRAKGGEEIEGRAGGGEGRVRAGAAIMTSGIVGDLTFRKRITRFENQYKESN